MSKLYELISTDPSASFELSFKNVKKTLFLRPIDLSVLVELEKMGTDIGTLLSGSTNTPLQTMTTLGWLLLDEDSKNEFKNKENFLKILNAESLTALSDAINIAIADSKPPEDEKNV
jgi:hypothetical protein